MSTLDDGINRGTTAARAPGLDQFRRNPFRVLRLAPTATSQQALWQGEKVLACARLGLPPPGGEPVSWLAPPTELEIRDAIQLVETPLARLVEQLLWFDFAEDPRGALLQEALASGDVEQLRAYSAMTEESSLPHRLNHTNLRLLLGFSALHGVGPELRPRPERGAPPGWKRADGLALLEDPHQLIRGRIMSSDSWMPALADAVQAWGSCCRVPI